MGIVPMRLEGRTAIVTGGGSGIGRACALLFAREGAAIAIVDQDADGAAETAALIAETGGSALVEIGDVGDPAFADSTVAEAEAAFGRVNILLTSAGISTGGTVLTTDPADWDRVFRVHVGGTWLFARSAIPALQRQGGGAIVTVASQLALAGGRNNSAYIAAKGAILSLTRTMALDFAADRIRVNALVPGAIETPLLAQSFARNADSAAARATSAGRHALGRIGKVEEVAAAALYLASNEASFTTGIALPVDGGWLAA